MSSLPPGSRAGARAEERSGYFGWKSQTEMPVWLSCVCGGTQDEEGARQGKGGSARGAGGSVTALGRGDSARAVFGPGVGFLLCRTRCRGGEGSLHSVNSAWKNLWLPWLPSPGEEAGLGARGGRLAPPRRIRVGLGELRGAGGLGRAGLGTSRQRSAGVRCRCRAGSGEFSAPAESHTAGESARHRLTRRRKASSASPGTEREQHPARARGGAGGSAVGTALRVPSASQGRGAGAAAAVPGSIFFFLFGFFFLSFDIAASEEPRAAGRLLSPLGAQHPSPAGGEGAGARSAFGGGQW